MRKKLKQRSINHYNKIFSIGRSYFPRSEFKELKFIGHMPRYRAYGVKNYSIVYSGSPSHPVFSAKGAKQVGTFVVADEARWSE